jgi:hypothetical protein
MLFYFAVQIPFVKQINSLESIQDTHMTLPQLSKAKKELLQNY